MKKNILITESNHILDNSFASNFMDLAVCMVLDQKELSAEHYWDELKHRMRARFNISGQLL